MGFRINTNIAAMNAQRNATQTNLALDKSLNSLSSGLRINTAADDASGMTIADSLRSQAQGLGQAINNANDGVAVVQTADGALDEYVKIINTVRTKSIQAASDGQNADSRKAIQADIDRLLEAADSIANTTQFNGQKLLDGTFTNKSFHIGAYAGETVSLSVGNVQTDSVGDIKGITGASTRDALVVNTNVTEGDAGYTLNADSLKVNDVDISGSINTLSPTRLTDASSIAAAITDATGLVAGATNTFTAGSAIAGGSIDSTNQLKINGIAIADTTVAADDADGALVRAINDISDQTGVTASLDANKKLVLDSADGSNISISTTTETAEVLQVSTATYTAPIATETISVTVNNNTYSAIFATDAATTYANLISNVAAAENITGSATGDVITFTAETGSPSFTIANATNDNGTDGTVATTTLGVAAIADADASDTITGLSADNLTDSSSSSAVGVLTSAVTNNVVIAKGDLVINGVDLAGTYGDNINAGTAGAALQAAIRDISGMEDSTIDALGNITLKVNNGEDLNISGVTANSTFNLTKGVTNESQAGEVQVYSDSSVKVGGTIPGAFGLTTGNHAAVSNNVSLESIDVTNRNSAEVAILITDSALKQLDATRSDLGSVQNQLESTIRNISVTQVNVTSAESQIRDVDFAQESSNFAKLNILAQSGTYALSQANAVQQNVMRLLQ